MRVIDLRNKRGAKIGESMVDDEDFDAINQFTWRLACAGYAVRGVSYKRECGSWSMHTIAMHRAIMIPPNDLEVDHISGNRLDNRRSNLRVCSHAENTRNQGTQSRLKPGSVTGVEWHSGKWVARIKINKAKIYLGRFASFADAVKSRRDAEVKYFGEFARSRQ